MAADEINLPDLVSHLGVDLTGLSGTVADARRQGSSVGAALGGGIQRELRDLVGNLPTIDVDASTDDVDRDLARVRDELEGLADQRIGVDVSIGDALRRLEELEPHLQRLSDTHPNINVQASTRQALRQLEELRAAARRADDTDVDIDVDVDTDGPNRLMGLLRRIPAMAGSAVGALSGVGVAAAGIGTAVPVVAGLVATLANVAPAAAVGVTGMAAVQLASGTLKLAMVGVEDAVTAALDPSKSEEFAEALEKLSPEARKFATAIRDAAPALRELQQEVQDRVFADWGDDLERTGQTVLPILRRGLLASADAVNEMGKGVLAAARDLGERGTLGRAIDSASTGLTNLSGIPGIVVKALGQIGAAAGPSFERLTDHAAKAAEGIGKKLDSAFESGRMEQAIEDAISLLSELWEVGENVFEIIGNIFGSAADGEGMVGVLQEITGALAEITGTPEFQEGLDALFDTMSKLATTAAPLLAKALGLIAPVLIQLGPPAQELIDKLGEGLMTILQELEDTGLLEQLATSLGEVAYAIAPLIPPLAELIAAILPYLVVWLEKFTYWIRLVGEFIERFAIPAIQIVTQLLRGDFSGALQGAKDLVVDMVSTTVIEFASWPGRAEGAISGLKGALGRQVGSATVSMLQRVRSGVGDSVAQLAGMPSRAGSALGPLAGRMLAPAASAGAQMLSVIARKIAEAVASVASLPSRAAGAVGGLSGVLFNAGRSLIQGFIDGIVSMIGAVARAAASAVDAARDYFPFSPAKKGPFSGRGYTSFSGRALIEGFEEGILARLPQLQAVLEQLPGLPATAGPAFPAIPSSLAVPTAEQLRPVYAGTGGGDQYNEIHLHGTEATPQGVVRELSWLGLVGRR
ncbi:hypothetical protein ACIQ6R_06395 [Streptomyces sp. NPDC096048]|uniref:hypothetical protein n=1 Tax=Streptomyces sp. NPDC096048 TaxID=3366072 RepID=UPI003825EC10